ncbi:SgrR family transcriptional regulator [Vibrio lentus]|nr:SgrR family transcriptional regulator [Vibrio lentus]
MANHKSDNSNFGGTDISGVWSAGTREMPDQSIGCKLLFVSERHVQTIIKTMVREGWVEWQASSGSQQKALLTCPALNLSMRVTRWFVSCRDGSVEQMLHNRIPSFRRKRCRG